jgi:membrane protein implicated in regulation of membrane protease activity
MEFLHNLGAVDWLVAAGVFLILEMLLPGFFFLWLAVGAGVVAAVVALLPLGWEWQLVLFSVLSVTSVLIWHRYFSRKQKQPEVLNNRAARYIGRIFILIEPIGPGDGLIQVDDTFWRVRGPEAPAGTKVKVVGVEDGIILKVEPVTENQSPQ